MIYLDNAATTLRKPRAVDEAVRRAMHAAAGYARGGYAAAMRAGETVYACREQAAALFGVRDPARVVFTMNATHALNLAIHALARPGMRIAVSGYEHNAVMRPLALRGIDPVVLDTPLWDCAAMAGRAKREVAEGAQLFILNHVSNVFGFAAPVEEIASLLDEAGVPLILDASQSAGILEIDVQRHPCLAAVCMPGHKGLYGPQGTGILLVLDDRIARQPLGGHAPAGFSARCARERHAQRTRDCGAGRRDRIRARGRGGEHPRPRAQAGGRVCPCAGKGAPHRVLCASVADRHAVPARARGIE